MITQLTGALADQKRERWLADARVAHEVKLARQARRSQAKTRRPHALVLGRLFRRPVAERLAADVSPMSGNGRRSLTGRAPDLSNREAVGHLVAGSGLVSTGESR